MKMSCSFFASLTVFLGTVSAFCSTIKIEFPHPGFSARSAICLTNVQTQQKITVRTKGEAIKLNEKSVIHHFELPDKFSGRYVLEFVEGSLTGSGWYSFVDLANEDELKELKAPPNFACLSISLDKACHELEAFDDTKDSIVCAFTERTVRPVLIPISLQVFNWLKVPKT